MNPVVFLLIFCGFVSLFLLFFYFFQEQFLFKSGKPLAKNHHFTFSNPFKEVFLETNDGISINAVQLTLNKPKGIVLFFHGNKDNLTAWGDRASYFLKYNYEVFIIDYRGYGKSTGSYNDKKMYQDALLAYQHLLKTYDSSKIVVYGYSLGGTFATKVASENTPKELILEAPFYNLKKASRMFLAIVPTFLLRYQFNSNTFIPSVKCPISIFHGTEDDTTSFEESKDFLALNKGKKNSFIPLYGADHHNIPTFKVYKQKLKELLER